MSAGYILLHRSVQDNWVWGDPEYFKAWVWLLMKASHERKEILIGSEVVELERGELITSYNTICRETGLTMKRARSFIKKGKKGAMLRQERGSKWTKLTICNYDAYQSNGQEKGKKRARKGHFSGQSEGNKELIINNYKQWSIDSENQKYRDFVTALLEDPPEQCLKLKGQLTEDRFKKLQILPGYSPAKLMDKIDAMNNTKDLTTKYTYFYSTLRAWMKK